MATLYTITADLYELGGKDFGRYKFDCDVIPELVALPTGEVFRCRALKTGGKIWTYILVPGKAPAGTVEVTEKIDWIAGSE